MAVGRTKPTVKSGDKVNNLMFSLHNIEATMNIEIYQSLRQEINHTKELIWKTQNWSILLTGAMIALIINILSKNIIIEDVINNQFLLCIIILCGFSVINYFLWFVVIQLSKNIIEMGAYLYELESKMNLQHGWENYVFQSRRKKQYDVTWLFEDVNFYIFISVLVLNIILCLYASDYYLSLLLVGFILIYGSAQKLLLNKYRKLKIEDMNGFFNPTNRQ